MRISKQKLKREIVEKWTGYNSKLEGLIPHLNLEHGAELYSGYLGDKTFVEQVEESNMARDFFTLSFTRETLDYIYAHQAEDIFLDLVKMLVFDAIIGNNDRHFYNWGVVKHLDHKHQPRFSPIYDTARALMWNRSEEQVISYFNDHSRCESMLRKYVNNSRPKIGIEKNSNCNHIDMVRLLNSGKFKGTKEIVYDFINEEVVKKSIEVLRDEFDSLLGEERMSLITKCLSLRFKVLLKEISSAKTS